MTLTFVLAGALTLALAFRLAEDRRPDVVEVVRVVALAGAIAVVMLSVFVYYALTGDVTGPFFNGFSDYGADVWGGWSPPRWCVSVAPGSAMWPDSSSAACRRTACTSACRLC